MKNIYLFLYFQCLNIVTVHSQVWTAQKVDIPMNVQMFNISAPDKTTVWVSGFAGDFHSQSYWTYEDGNTTVARSNDGGLSWQQSTINAGAGGSVTGLIAADNLTAWATCLNYGVGGKVFKTTDGGSNWKQQRTAAFSNGSYVDWIYFWNANEGVCMGDPTNHLFEIFRTTDGGDNWVRVSTNNVPTALNNEVGFNEIYQVSGDTIWFGTSYGRIFRSVNRGQSWQAFLSPFSRIDVIAFSKGNGLGISFYNYLATSYYLSAMATTTNGGVTWSSPINTPFTNQAVFDATYVPESNYIVVTTRSNNSNGAFNTYLSRNEGASWTQIDNHAPIVKVKFVNPYIGYGGGHKNSATTPSTLYRYTGSTLTGLLTPSVLEANISLSPNPTADHINIQLTYKEASNFRLNINNVLGDLVYFEDFKDISTINKSLNIKQFPSGTYIVTIANPTGSLSRKFVKTE
jgi:Secretion system C-terminal sorting domain/Photosynthesis system II assembly factor YCF48